MNEAGFLLHAGQLPRFSDQFIVQIEGGSHADEYALIVCTCQHSMILNGVI
jgi:hypothetical protein